IGTFVNFNGKLHFTANDGTHGSQLWTSDGTAAGTRMLTNFDSSGGPGGGPMRPINWGLPTLDNLTVAGQHLYLTRNIGGGQTELWQSDGTSGGTKLVRDFQLSRLFPIPLAQTSGAAQGAIMPYIGPAAVSNLTNVNGILYFEADDGAHGS